MLNQEPTRFAPPTWILNMDPNVTYDCALSTKIVEASIYYAQDHLIPFFSIDQHLEQNNFL
jgi:hypothetical protein